MKNNKKIIIITFFILTLLLIGYIFISNESDCWWNSYCMICEAGGWKLKTFSNTCADLCWSWPNCGDAMRGGCDCGRNSCWNWTKCVRE